MATERKEKGQDPEASLVASYRKFIQELKKTLYKSKDVNIDSLMDTMQAAVDERVKWLGVQNKKAVEQITKGTVKGAEKKVNLIRANTYIDLNSALKDSTDQLMNRLRKLVKPYKEGTENMWEVKRDLFKDFMKRGLLEIHYANGRVVPLEEYIKMVTRTARAETINTSTMAQAETLGTDYVRMPPSDVSCSLCLSRSDRVYCISGKDKRFPPLSELYPNPKYPNIHPNCRCQIVPFIMKQHSKKEIDEISRKSRRSFKVDNFSDRQKDFLKKYAKEQSDLRKYREEAKEYKEAKKRYGDKMPYKTLGGFRNAWRSWEKTHKSHQTFWQDKLKR